MTKVTGSVENKRENKLGKANALNNIHFTLTFNVFYTIVI